jgi:peptide/nickel transport system substrate-binding protein
VRIVATLGAVVAALVLSLEAASGGEAAAVREGGTFRIGVVGGFFDSIDPALASFPPPFIVTRATCAGLVTLPDKPLPAGLRIVPEIAIDYPRVTNGGRTYTFTLERGVRFSTGAPVTARSFAYTINRILHPTMKSPRATTFEDIVGARGVIDGKATGASGVVARGRTLTIRLTRPVGDFTARLVDLCVVPDTVPIDAEGAKAPVPGAGPYYIAEYVPGRRVVLERNRFYRGERPHHVDRFVVDLSADAATLLDRVDRGELDYAWVPNQDLASRALELRRKYGINKARFFVVPANNLRMFVLNTERPLFRNNVRLRQAVNFAVDRPALLRERGPLAGYLTDQYLPPRMPGFRNERVYPLKGPDLARARALARGNTRTGKAVLYVPAAPLGLAQGEILKQNLARIGLRVEIEAFPAPALFGKLSTRGEPFDIGWIGWLGTRPDGFFLNFLFDGRTIGQTGFGNYSYFNSREYNRLLENASRLPVGSERNRTYGRLDVDISRNAAPGIPYAYDNTFTLVSRRSGCVIVNPDLDLAAVCLR